MFGVVLWSGQDKQTAMLWCEDHKELAVLSLLDDWNTDRQHPQAGDLVSFEAKQENGVRRARNAVPVVRGHALELAAELRAAVEALSQGVSNDDKAAGEAAEDPDSDTIVAFPHHLRRRRAGRVSTVHPKTGTTR